MRNIVKDTYIVYFGITDLKFTDRNTIVANSDRPSDANVWIDIKFRENEMTLQEYIDKRMP